MMKKTTLIIAAILSAALTLSLGGCQSDKKGTPTQPSDTSAVSGTSAAGEDQSSHTESSAGEVSQSRQASPSETSEAVSAASEEGTPTEESSASQTEQTTSEASTQPTPMGDEPVYEPSEISGANVNEKLRTILDSSEANGYTIAKIKGDDRDQLILSYGSNEEDKFYSLFTIKEGDVFELGDVVAASCNAYLSDGLFYLYNTNTGSYGPIYIYDDVITVDWKINEEQKPAPGERVSFTPINDYSKLPPA